MGIRIDTWLNEIQPRYASTDLSAARLLQNRRFNYALVGMLDCLRQLIAYGRSKKKGWASGGLEYAVLALSASHSL